MKKIVFISVLLLATGSTGCKTIAKKMYGIKNPDFETARSVEKFKNEVFGSDVPYLIVSFDTWMKATIISIPDVYVFTGSGKYIPYRDTLKPNCNGPAEVFLSELDPGRNYNYGAELNMSDFLKKLHLPECGQAIEMNDDTVDFYIFMTWANWIGKKICREKNADWMKALSGNKTIRYKIFMVNYDFQDCWTADQKNQLQVLYKGSR